MFKAKHKANIEEMNEKRALPIGMKEFDEWSDRIIMGAMLTGVNRLDQKFALADMILHLNATEDHKEDAHFIKYLRKVAVNQIADAKRKEIQTARKAEILAKEQAESDVLEEPSV